MQISQALFILAPSLVAGFAAPGRCAAFHAPRAAATMGFFDQLKKSFNNRERQPSPPLLTLHIYHQY